MEQQMVVRPCVMVPFEGTELVCVREGDEVWVSIRRVCEALGLTLPGQLEKLRGKPWAAVTTIVTTAPDGKNYRTTMIQLDYLPMWLATIEPGRVAPEVAPKLTAYQCQCARVLRDHFYPNLATVPASPPALSIEIYHDARHALDVAHAAKLVDDRGYALRLADLLRRVGIDILTAPGGSFAPPVTVGGVPVTGPALVLPLKSLDDTYSARALGDPFGLTAKRVNDLAKELGIYDNPDFGARAKFIREDDGKEVANHWRYNQAGKQAMQAILRTNARKKPLPPAPPAPPLPAEAAAPPAAAS